jgi:hypothetical protein
MTNKIFIKEKKLLYAVFLQIFFSSLCDPKSFHPGKVKSAVLGGI